MKALAYASFGEPFEVLTVTNFSIPEPNEQEVRIKTILSPIHNHDLWTIKGVYGYKPKLPAIGGSEAVGYIDSVGSLKSKFKKGDRVAVSSVPGTWAEYFIAREDEAVLIPDDIKDESAAQILAMPFSAITLLDFLSLDEGDWVIQNASNGAVGKTFYFLAKSKGINVVNLVRRNSSIEEMEELNITNTFCTELDDWKTDALSLTKGKGFAAAIDSVGGGIGGALLSLLSDRGTLISFGTASGEPLEIPAGDLIFKQATIKGFWALQVKKDMEKTKKANLFEYLITQVRESNLILPYEKICTFNDISNAFSQKESSLRGKILLKP